VVNAAYKRSWREVFLWRTTIVTKKGKFGRGRPVETATAEEIAIGGLRQLLLDDFHKLLG